MPFFLHFPPQFSRRPPTSLPPLLPNFCRPPPLFASSPVDSWSSSPKPSFPRLCRSEWGPKPQMCTAHAVHERFAAWTAGVGRSPFCSSPSSLWGASRMGPRGAAAPVQSAEVARGLAGASGYPRPSPLGRWEPGSFEGEGKERGVPNARRNLPESVAERMSQGDRPRVKKSLSIIEMQWCR